MIDNTLYISDLDGTLLNSECKISRYAADTLNNLIASGLNFTVATARTNETVKLLLKDIDINLPVILMNGVAMYDLKKRRFVHYEAFEKSCICDFFDIISNHGSKGFLYTINQSTLKTYYVNTDTPNAEKFMNERIEKFGKKFTKIGNFSECAELDCIYFSVSDKSEKLKPLYDDLKNLKGFLIEYYRDIYDADFWYLEVCSDKASKYNAAVNLKEMLKLDRITAFGDNLNDLPLFAAADFCCAVSNAKDEVKQKADSVILSNNQDGVARFLEQLCKTK